MGTSGRNIKRQPAIDESVWAAETTAEEVVLAEFADETALGHVSSPKVVEIASYRARLSEWRLLDPRTPWPDVARMIFVGCLSATALGGAFAIGFGYIWSDRSGTTSATNAAPGTVRPYLDSWWPVSPLPSAPRPSPTIATTTRPATPQAKASMPEFAKPRAARANQSSAAVRDEAVEPAAPETPATEESPADNDQSVLPSEPMALRESAPSLSTSSALTVMPTPQNRATYDATGIMIEPTAPPSVIRRGDTDAVRHVISQYQQAYSRKDLGAMAMVWPSLDTDGVARAFADIDHQALVLNSCRVMMAGDLATAVCPGQVRYVGRVGAGRIQERNATWTIALERRGDAWQFVRLSVR